MIEMCFDIETIGRGWENLDEGTRKYLKEKSRENENPEEMLGLNAMTGEIAAISILQNEKKEIETFYQNREEKNLFSNANDYKKDDYYYRFIVCSEEEIIKAFYDRIANAGKFITFNGLRFDCPFIALRASLLGVKPTRNINTNRFRRDEHIDLYDVFTFNGNIKGINLETYCKIYGTSNPKEEGISGKDVQRYFNEKKYREIAEYCSRDVYSTYSLYKKIKDYLL
ncbi:MAG: ribonuclease H-like domain-containing protein [bacterium]|nr:ribonuclease H-like domain-containing protein [bacterium]